MAHKQGKLSAVALKKTKPGLYADGGGLYLQVGAGGARSWIYRYLLNGRRRDMGLGSVLAIGLADARDAAARCRMLRAQGIDPIERRTAERTALRLAAARAVTFKQCAEDHIAANADGWRNAKHDQQWRNTLSTYAYPVIGDYAVGDVDTAMVMKVLQQPIEVAGGSAPLWSARPETANRLRGRLEAVLDRAKTLGYRTGENPAAWKGHLALMLPARGRVRRIQHHAALPFTDMPGFVANLRKQPGTAALALEFLILTAARTSEVIGATWSELDLAAKIWTVPPTRMKGGREHRVPLGQRALDLVAAAHAPGSNLPPDAYVFPGRRPDAPLSNMALLALLRRMKRGDLTAHGFRSTFRDWAAERTDFANHVVEQALAHAIGDRVEAAYRRGDLFQKRRHLMDAWGAYATGGSKP